MNKILRLFCRQADFKKIVSIGFFAAFLTVFLSAGMAQTTQASFWDWFSLNKANNDSQQAAAIAEAIIKVVSPNGGEVWKAGTKKNISFKGNSRAIINISLEWSGGALSIGESVTLNKSKTSAYSWTIPTTLEERSDYKVRIDYKGGQGSDSSDKTFTIKNTSNSSSSRSSKSSATTTKIYLLKIIKSGNGSVTDEQRQIVCGTDCRGDSGTYVAGSEAKLTAVPDGGYVFEKFAPEKECSSIYTSGFGFNDNQWIKQAFAYRAGENVVCITTMNKNKTITAIFKKIPKSSSSSSKSSSSRSSKSSSSRSSRSSATTTPSNV